jgi:hypothetical protein
MAAQAAGPLSLALRSLADSSPEAAAGIAAPAHAPQAVQSPNADTETTMMVYRYGVAGASETKGE